MKIADAMRKRLGLEETATVRAELKRAIDDWHFARVRRFTEEIDTTLKDNRGKHPR